MGREQQKKGLSLMIFELWSNKIPFSTIITLNDIHMKCIAAKCSYNNDGDIHYFNKIVCVCAFRKSSHSIMSYSLSHSMAIYFLHTHLLSLHYILVIEFPSTLMLNNNVEWHTHSAFLFNLMMSIHHEHIISDYYLCSVQKCCKCEE
jgi:hypothetical protein